MNDEFYIGWEAKAPPGIGGRVRRAVVGLLALAAALGVLLAVPQRTIGVSVFEWGNLKDFSGVFQSQPYPHLLVARPGAGAGELAFSAYYLVNQLKHGIDSETAARFDAKFVTLRGTLIYRGNQTMIEVAKGSLKTAADPGAEVAKALAIQPVDLGQQTLTGEIVDSKCFLGVMNPGQLEPHRACAIRCISGGVPPVLLIRQKDGPALYLLLVSADGRPVNQQVLDLVAEPVEITGGVVRQGDLLVLRADPATYRRVGK
jgi:hypothetical protein